LNVFSVWPAWKISKSLLSPEGHLHLQKENIQVTT
jgi:hypothetical protein